MKVLKIIGAILVILAIASAIYMQVNLQGQDAYTFQPHELSTDINAEIQEKDFAFVPLWALIFVSVFVIGINVFTLMSSKHSYYSMSRFIIMILLTVLSVFFLFEAFSHIGTAQFATSKTNAFVYSFSFLMMPFMKTYGLLAIVMVIKQYNVKNIKVKEEDRVNTKIMRDILNSRD